MLQAEGLTVRVGGADGGSTLLRDVSFPLRAGEVVALLGPNGAGKSTLLRCLSGEQSPSAGRTLLGGKPVLRWKACDRARRLAVLPQNPRLGFPFTALEVVLLGRTPHCGSSRPGAADREIAAEALHAVDGAELRDRLFPALSGGEQQRVQLARVLCQLWDVSPGQPRVLLLDEPLSGLDLCHQHASLRIAREFAARGGAVLVSLHDLNQAAQFADRVLVLQRGHLLADGPPHAVLTSALIASVFATRTLSLRHPALAHPVIVPLPDGLAAAARTARRGAVPLPAPPARDGRTQAPARLDPCATGIESSTLSSAPVLLP